MLEVRYDLGAGKMLRVAGGIWHGDVCVFEFADTLAGIAGTAACDWRQPTARLTVLEGDASSTMARQLLQQLTTLLLPFHRGASADVSEAALRKLYGSDYQTTMRLAVDDANETAFKQHLVQQVLTLGATGKMLDAGLLADPSRYLRVYELVAVPAPC